MTSRATFVAPVSAEFYVQRSIQLQGISLYKNKQNDVIRFAIFYLMQSV